MFDELGLGDLTFGLPVRPGRRDFRLHSGPVFDYAVREGGNEAELGLLDPWIGFLFSRPS